MGVRTCPYCGDYIDDTCRFCVAVDDLPANHFHSTELVEHLRDWAYRLDHYIEIRELN